MTETKFTPAPWTLDEDGEILDCNNDSIALLEIEDFDAEIEQELKANANLIATAPELYHLLSEMTGLLHEHHSSNYCSIGFEGELVKKSVTVLAKARGEHGQF